MVTVILYTLGREHKQKGVGHPGKVTDGPNGDIYIAYIGRCAHARVAVSKVEKALYEAIGYP